MKIMSRLAKGATLLALLGVTAGTADAGNQNIRDMTYVEAIRAVKTPRQAQDYIRNNITYADDKETYGEEEYIASFKRIHEGGRDDCDGAAFAAAALLSDNDYRPLILSVFRDVPGSNVREGHSLFLYIDGNKWGTLGVDPTNDSLPKYSSIVEIVRKHNCEYFVLSDISKHYADWLDNDINMKESFYKFDMIKINTINTKNKQP